jgi:NAD(P)H dehydrogenase (quinone)
MGILAARADRRWWECGSAERKLRDGNWTERPLRTLLVVAHVRRSSLTGQVADAFAEAAGANGHEFEWADLARERFDPVLREADEPDWDDPDKVYSEDVQREMSRIERNEATVMIFPIYWWSMPALLKGWIDRVWNNGWAYGARKFPHNRVWMIGIAGGLPDSFAKRGYDTAIQTQLDVGILDYCGIRDRRLQLLHGSIEGKEYPSEILLQARTLGSEY